MRKIAVAVALLLQAWTPLFAFEADIRETKLPVEWYHCDKADDCDLVGTYCGPSQAVRHDHVRQAQDAMTKKYGPYRGCNASSPDTSSALCEKGQCVTVSRDVRKIAGMPPQWFACQAQSDCERVAFTCNRNDPENTQGLAVRREFKRQAEEKILKIFGYYGACSSRIDSRFVAALCEKGQCVSRYVGPSFQLHGVAISKPRPVKPDQP